MTAEVVPLAEYRPHLTGNARCMNCRATWPVVAPVGTTRFECKECGTTMGALVGACEPPVGELFWQCKCGNDLFMLLPNGAPMCAHCGLRATSWADA